MKKPIAAYIHTPSPHSAARSDLFNARLGPCTTNPTNSRRTRRLLRIRSQEKKIHANAIIVRAVTITRLTDDGTRAARECFCFFFPSLIDCLFSFGRSGANVYTRPSRGGGRSSHVYYRVCRDALNAVGSFTGSRAPVRKAFCARANEYE